MLVETNESREASLHAPWGGLVPLAWRVALPEVLERLPCAPEAATTAQWLAAGLPMDEAARLVGAPGLDGAWLRWGGTRWPERLSRVPKAPVALAYEGALSLLDAPAVAVVGARRCTAYGRAWARRIAAAVAAAGGVVVSGMAAGIDAEAHMAAEGRTIAVLGQGLGVGMPSWQQRLRERVLAEGGLVISELPHDHPATLWSFPLRNRVIAGLSSVVAVVEASRKSGTRSTAHHARRQGRPLLALPGPVDAPASEGCLDLIEQGARMIRGAETVLEAASLGSRAGAVGGGGEEEEEGWRALLARGASLDALVEASGAPLLVLLAQLGAMEAAGEVERLAGQQYRRTR